MTNLSIKEIVTVKEKAHTGHGPAVVNETSSINWFDYNSKNN